MAPSKCFAFLLRAFGTHILQMRARFTNSATVAEIAAHWRVTNDVVRKLLRVPDIHPASTRPDRYLWADIWSLEGIGWVPPADKAAFKAPLMAADELGEIFHGTPERTITDWAAKKKIPAIRIGKQWRFRRITLDRWLDGA